MKKTKWLGALALVCSLVFAFAFFGCGDPVNGGLADGGEINADTDPKDIITQQVTEEQWKLAFESSNFENFSMIFDQKSDIDPRPIKLVVQGEIHKNYTSEIFPDSTYERYSSIEDGTEYNYRYNSENKTWSRESGSFNQFNINFYVPFQNSYSNFTYDKEAKAYTGKDFSAENSLGIKYAVKSAIFKLVDGKISYAEFTMVQGEEEDAITFEMKSFIYNYGKTTVTLPTITE